MSPWLLHVASFVLALLRLGLWLLALAASAQLLRLGLWAFWRPLTPPDGPPKKFADGGSLPVVTVQLPMCNERFVARRALDAACALDWPRDRLQIQVLDDSDPGDPTCAIVDAAAAQYCAAGFSVQVVRRSGRAGYKAGNLDNALPLARGEYIAILDADAVPPKDLLLRLVPVLARDPTLGFAQGRSSFLNEDQNLLTRVQALILHGLFLVEQAFLGAHRRPVQFNGSGGVWRKAALLAAGGWVASGEGGTGVASVAEDLDLSYRAQLCGYRGQHLPEVAVATELPATMAAFRTQQQRWVRGGAQVLRSLARKLSAKRRSDGLGLGDLLTMLGHLARHARQPYLLGAILWLPLVVLPTIGGLEGLGALPLPRFSPPGGLLGALVVLHAALFVYYGAALRRLGRSPLPALLLAPVVVALSMGLSLALTLALLRGVLGRGPAVFVRTPKTGTVPAGSGAAPRYRAPRDTVAVIEVVLGGLHAALALWALHRGHWLIALGLGALVAAGLLWVGVASLSGGGSAPPRRT